MLAVVALITAILGMSIVALVLGYIARGQIDRSGGAEEGRTYATVAIVLGWLEIALGALVLISIVAASGGSSY